MIAETTLVVATDSEQFHEKLASSIAEMQRDGLVVEVQYNPVSHRYSALLLGRSC